MLVFLKLGPVSAVSYVRLAPPRFGGGGRGPTFFYLGKFVRPMLAARFAFFCRHNFELKIRRGPTEAIQSFPAKGPRRDWARLGATRREQI